MQWMKRIDANTNISIGKALQTNKEYRQIANNRFPNVFQFQTLCTEERVNSVYDAKNLALNTQLLGLRCGRTSMQVFVTCGICRALLLFTVAQCFSAYSASTPRKDYTKTKKNPKTFPSQQNSIYTLLFPQVIQKICVRCLKQKTHQNILTRTRQYISTIYFCVWCMKHKTKNTSFL